MTTIGTEQDRTNDYGEAKKFIIDWLATFSRNKLGGKSPTISGIEQNYLRQIFNRNKWNTLQRNIVWKLSTIGEVAGSITIDRNGVPVYMVADSISEHTRIGGEIVKQRQITNYTIGDRPYVLDEHFFFENGVPTVVRTVEEYDAEKGQMVEVQNGLKLLLDFGLYFKPKETLPVGSRLPCFHIENLPMPNGRGRSDIYGADEIIDMIQRYWNRLGWDLEVNMPRIFKQKAAGSVRSNEVAKMKEQYVGNGIIEEVQTISSIVGETGSPITIYNSQYQGGEIFKTFKSMFSMLFEKQGFARDIPSEKGTAQETDFQLQQARNSEYTSFLTKEDNLQQGFQEMLEIGLEMAGKPYKDIAVQVNTVEVRDPLSQIELISKALEIGVMSQKDAVKDYNKIDETQAKVYMEEINKEKEEKAQMFSQPQDNQDNQNNQNDLNNQNQQVKGE